MSAEDHFGEQIGNTSDVEFLEYFRRECLLDRRKSPVYSAVCYDMIENYPLALFRDLRNNASSLQTCNDCNFCLPVAPPLLVRLEP
ncbi:unnamed protein product [Heligmosomoides polygyrus]|uniref:Mediator of RNA polymerase II transcription subunit 31 n=1 Tax=Heligmosomoides polygyrus TaxID=6339 RepID=A0A183F8R3_HELPZ|nr:unnamed protein product [Heligmosomoides polygyrus]